MAPDILAELNKLQQADLAIFSFPLYWFSVWAIMTRWFDRLLISGLCFGGKRLYDSGVLAGKCALLALTCGGKPPRVVEGGM